MDARNGKPNLKITRLGSVDMKRKLVRFLMKIKLNKLAFNISPSLYMQCIGEDCAQSLVDSLNRFKDFAIGFSGSFEMEEE